MRAFANLVVQNRDHVTYTEDRGAVPALFKHCENPRSLTTVNETRSRRSDLSTDFENVEGLWTPTCLVLP